MSGILNPPVVIAEPEFKDFGKIERFRTLTALITEKLDGANCQVYVPEDPQAPIKVGSRNQWVTPQKDCMGMAAFLQANAELFRMLGPGRHFGEWWGQGIQRRYGLDEKRLWFFNVRRFAGGLPTPLIEALGTRVGLVPVLYQGPFDSQVIQATIDKLYAEGSVAVPGWAKPEGVIIEFGGLRRKVTDNGDKHKGEA
jgi:hypothetical protein